MSKFGIQKKIKKKSNKNLIIVFFIEFYVFLVKTPFQSDEMERSYR